MMRVAAAGMLLAGSVGAQPAEVGRFASPAVTSGFVLTRAGDLGAAACADGKLRLWTLPSGRVARTIDIGNRSFDSIAISADGSWIAAGDHAGSYTVWSVLTGVPRMQLDMLRYPFAMVFSPDGKRLAIAPGGQPVQIYEVATGKKLTQLAQTLDGSAAIAFSRDGRRIATADTDTVVRVYDGDNGELLARHTDFLLMPGAASFSPDGKQLLVAGVDKVIVMLDSSTGRAIRKSAKLADPVTYLEVSPDGILTAAGLMHADNMLLPAPVIVSETQTGRKVQEWTPASRVLGGGWTSDGHLLVAIGADKGLSIWRVR